ncbi:MAG TPA: hypothetical protein VFP32_01140, partial [Candidatus Saccharimonadales bacterium]|nr:hypothetical protein [Candidatus Saccharimonadales bacterium]
MAEVVLSESIDYEARVAKGLVLGPLAMRCFLRSQYNPETQQDIYFDIATGQLVIGPASLQAHYEEGGTDKELRVLHDLLISPEFSADGYKFDPFLYGKWDDSDFDRGAYFLVDQADYIEAGHQYKINKHLMDRGNSLGIFPSSNQVDKRFGNRTNFFARLGIPEVKTVYLDLDRVAAYEYLINCRESQGAPLTKAMLNSIASADPLTPGYEALTDRIAPGGLAQFEKDFGYWPTHPTYQDCVDWGINFMIANQGALPTKQELEIFASVHRGPSNMFLRKFFDGKLTVLHSEINQSYEAEKQKRDGINAELLHTIRSGNTIRILFGKNYSDQQAICSYARYTLLNSLLPRLSEDKRIILSGPRVNDARFILGAQNKGATITADTLSKQAEALGLYKEIWRAPGYIEKHNVESTVKDKLDKTRGELSYDEEEKFERYIENSALFLHANPHLLADRLYWKPSNWRFMIKKKLIGPLAEVRQLSDNMALFGEIT